MCEKKTMKTQAIARISNVKHTLPRIGLIASAFLLAATLGLSIPAKQANAAACATPATSLGSATTTVDIPTAGDYTIWSRIKAPDTTNNSYSLEVDGECHVVGDAASIPASAWTWVDYTDGTAATKLRLTLTTGSHDIKFVGKEAGVALDKVMFVQDASCVPTDLGTNCASTSDNAGPGINLTSPEANATVTGTTDITAVAQDNPGGSNIAKVEFYDGTTKLGESTADPYTYSWDSTKVPNGSHVIKAVAYDAAGSSADSQVQVTVQNAGNDTGGGGDGGGGTGGTDNPGGGTGGGTDADIQNPTIPGAVKATPSGSNKVVVTWGASTDNVGVAGYTIVRDGVEVSTFRTEGGGTANGQTSGTAGTTYTDSSVQPGTTYSYQVLAFDAAGNKSELSDGVDVTTGELTTSDTQAPSSPTDPKAQAAGSKQINLTWRASTDNIGVSGYEIYRSQGNKTGDGTRIATINATSFGDSGLNPSTAYTYYIVAKDAAGNRSPESERVTATTSASTATSGLPSTGPGDDSLGLTGPGGIKGSINLKVSGGRVVVWINGTKRIFSLDSRGNYNVAGLPRGVYSIKYTLRNYRVSFLWLKVDDGVKSQNVALKQ